LSLKYDGLLSNFAINCNLRHYMKGPADTNDMDVSDRPARASKKHRAGQQLDDEDEVGRCSAA